MVLANTETHRNVSCMLTHTRIYVCIHTHVRTHAPTHTHTFICGLSLTVPPISLKIIYNSNSFFSLCFIKFVDNLLIPFILTAQHLALAHFIVGDIDIHSPKWFDPSIGQMKNDATVEQLWKMATYDDHHHRAIS